MPHDRNGRTGGSHASGVYRRFTLVHFTYALVLTIPVALMLLALDLEIVMVGLVIAETLAFALMPHLGIVKRAVDARIRATARASASIERAVLLLRMSEVHRRELQSLEKIAASLRERTDAATGATGERDDGEDCTGVERLVELYVRIAIAHRSSCASLEVVGPCRLEEELASLESRAATEPRAQREWLERRLGILQMRQKARRTALDEQTAMARDLAMIADTLRWMQENCAGSGAEAMRTELDFALADRERDGATLRELSSLRDTEFDASVIRLGRDPVMHRIELPQLRVAVTPTREADDGSESTVITEPVESPSDEAITMRIWQGLTAREAS